MLGVMNHRLSGSYFPNPCTLTDVHTFSHLFWSSYWREVVVGTPNPNPVLRNYEIPLHF